MDRLFDLDSRGLAVLSIPGALGTLMMPHLYSLYISAQAIRTKQAPNVQYISPRPGFERIGALEKQTPLTRQISRARAAHANGWEQFALHVGAIICALYADLPARTVNKAALVFLLSRLVYNYVYVFSTRKIMGPGRTVIYAVGLLAQLSLYFQAAAKLS